MEKINKFKSTITLFIIAVMTLMTSCDSFEYDLPDANSKEDQTPPEANFSASETDDYLTYTFANASTSATAYSWDFGDTTTDTDVSTEVDGEYTYPDEGTYTITLTATDNNGLESVFSLDIEVVEPDTPVAIRPNILNGDFSDGQNDWKFSSFTGGTTSAFNTSSDGSPLLYDGTDSGESKTAGAKWTQTTSSGIYRSSSTRYAYQAITVSPNRDYILEFEYSIKNDLEENAGAKIVGEILNGHYEDGAAAVVASDAGPIIRSEGNKLLGKGNFTVISKTFTANATGLVSILIWGETKQDAYLDNVKVYPAD